MDIRDITANCAICGGPGEPECPCEGERLKIAVDQAEKRWIEAWLANMRDWVTNSAVAHVTDTFNQLRARRQANHLHYLQQLPYYPIYLQHRGRPPLHPQILMQLHRQIQEATADFKRGIDADWKSCVMRYPEVLAHFFHQISVDHPEKSHGPMLEGLTPTVMPGVIPQPALLTQHGHPPSTIGIGNKISPVHAPMPPPLMRSATAPARKDAIYAPPPAPQSTKTSRPKPPKHSSSHAPQGSVDELEIKAARLRAQLEGLTLAGIGRTKSSAGGGVKSRQRESLYGADFLPHAPAPPPQRANSVAQGETTASAASRRKRRDSGQFYGLAGQGTPVGLAAGLGAGMISPSTAHAPFQQHQQQQQQSLPSMTGWPGPGVGMDRRGNYAGYYDI